MTLKIDKPVRSSSKGTPPSIDEPVVKKNLNVPATSDLVPLSLAVDAAFKKELKLASAETGDAMVTILKEGYSLWKEKNGRL